MKKALVIENGLVSEVRDAAFDVAPPYYWVDCPDNIVGGGMYEYVNSEFLPIQKPVHTNTAEENKKIAQQLLLDSDFSVLPDVNLTNKADWEAYRSLVRLIAVNPQPGNITWPTKPEAVWG